MKSDFEKFGSQQNLSSENSIFGDVVKRVRLVKILNYKLLRYVFY